jgi:hypothetical protein
MFGSYIKHLCVFFQRRCRHHLVGTHSESLPKLYEDEMTIEHLEYIKLLNNDTVAHTLDAAWKIGTTRVKKKNLT